MSIRPFRIAGLRFVDTSDKPVLDREARKLFRKLVDAAVLKWRRTPVGKMEWCKDEPDEDQILFAVMERRKMIGIWSFYRIRRIDRIRFTGHVAPMLPEVLGADGSLAKPDWRRLVTISNWFLDNAMVQEDGSLLEFQERRKPGPGERDDIDDHRWVHERAAGMRPEDTLDAALTRTRRGTPRRRPPDRP